MTTTQEAGSLGGKARAAKIAAGEQINLGGRPKVKRRCPICIKMCKSATEARRHCAKPR